MKNHFENLKVKSLYSNRNVISITNYRITNINYSKHCKTKLISSPQVVKLKSK